MNLKDFKTCELVEELSKREAVEKITASPYADYKIIVDGNEIVHQGPAVILRVWD